MSSDKIIDHLRASLQNSEDRLRAAGVERERADEQIRYTARHDMLTGLANRVVFVDALQQAIERAQRDGESFAVLYLDIDQFKDVNDTLGHPVGDVLLQSLADRLRASIRGMDTLARFGGDEFALLQTNIPEPLDAAVLADKLLAAINAPFAVLGNEIRTGASIGIAVYGVDSPSAESLLSHAEVALYRAKAEGRGTYRFFTETMDREVRTRVSLGADLRGAIAAGQLYLAYQPQIDVDTGRFVGVEALARWQHPKRGLVSPTTFIPIAEQNGMIVPLGAWVLHEACRQMKEWIVAGIAPPLMAVNVSGQQFKTPFALENTLSGILQETGLQPQRLELEFTESVLMEVSRAHNDALLRLRKTGHRIAIDDFGTGYSSLEYLARFPVDRIKIAQSFMVDLTGTSGNPVIVRAAIGLAHELNLDVVVEGVENQEQLQLVRSWGCRKVQGFYYSRALRAEDLCVLLRAGKISPRQPLAVAAAGA
jgi:diguanylate cyclase (GGDEF)-like protein